MKNRVGILAVLLTMAVPAFPGAVIFNNDNPTNAIAVASGLVGGVEHETGDDFILGTSQQLISATFTGLIPLGALASSITDVGVEIYRVFPNDSTNPPSGNVPTRVNSPSDVEFADRDTSAANLTFSTIVAQSSFGALNSVVSGIHIIPNQTTGGDGPVTGEEVQFTVNFTTPINLPADHYFFVPQVTLSSGSFLWLSATRPIVGQFAFAPDLQGWTRDTPIDPDWLRVGTDIVGGAPAPTFNFAFSLTATPEPGSIGLVICGLGLLGWKIRRK